jgi:hypothetical protein
LFAVVRSPDGYVQDLSVNDAGNTQGEQQGLAAAFQGEFLTSAIMTRNGFRAQDFRDHTDSLPFSVTLFDGFFQPVIWPYPAGSGSWPILLHPKKDLDGYVLQIIYLMGWSTVPTTAIIGPIPTLYIRGLAARRPPFVDPSQYPENQFYRDLKLA